MQAEQASTNRDWLWRPAAIVFISNACIMIIELVAGRIIAPVVGVSLYTWTSIIGVILAGVSIGNWVGGRIADRLASRRTLGLLFIAAGLGALSVLLSMSMFGEKGLFDMPYIPLIARMVVYVSAMFLLPSILLGLITPVVIKLSLQSLSHTGSVVGKIYAASALGSIVGTFATGYLLISLFGTRLVAFGTGMLLIALGVLLGNWFRSRVPQAALSLALLAAVPLVPRDGILKGPCVYETDYYCIRVRDEQKDGIDYKVLLLDRLVHSFTAPNNPSSLRYGYEMAAAEVVDYMVARDSRVDAFFVGAGGYTLPKFIDNRFGSKASIDVAEIDPKVTEVGHEFMGLPMDTPIHSFQSDARLYLKTLDPNRRYHVVLGDAFNDFSVPYHLTTKEFNDLVRAHLTDDGVYVLNIIDGGDMPFLGAFIRTLQQTFAHVYLVPNGKWLNIPRNTYVLLASSQALDLDALRKIDAGDNWRNIDDWIVTDQEMNAVAANGTFVLTDDYVPTDQLLVPMFEASEATK